jgi:hypothetical protein
MTTLDELEKLLAASHEKTPRPWKTNGCELYDANGYSAADYLDLADAALIVAAINALPALLESARRVEEMRAALAFYADPANHIGYPDPNAKVYIETSAIDRDGGNRARALIAGVAIEDRFVQIGWTNEAQISYVTLDGEGAIYPDTQEGCDVPVYRAALKGT